MINYIFTLHLCLYIILSASLSAQDAIPYLCANGTYGFSDVNGNIRIPCQYDKVYPKYEHQLYVARQGDKSGIIDFSGNVIVEPVLEGNVTTMQTPAFADDNEIAIDTFLAARTVKHWIVLHPALGKKSLIIASKEQVKTKKFQVRSYLPHPIQFNYDVFPFAVDGKVNFYHKDGYAIFEKPVINGAALSDTHLAIEGTNGKIALSDFQGKQITPFAFEEIKALSDNHFLLNGKGSYINYTAGSPYTAHAGMINAAGAFILDTIYSHIQPIDEGYLVKKEGKVGILDKDFKTVLPFDYDHIRPAASGQFLCSHGDQYTIISAPSFTSVFSESSRIDYQSALQLYKVYRGYDSVQYYTPDFDILPVAKGEQVLQGSDSTTYLIRSKEKGYRVLSKNGKKMVRQFSGMMEMAPRRHKDVYLYIVEKDSLKGLVNNKYDYILPAEYAEVQVMHIRDQLFIFAKKEHANTYQIFDKDGKRTDQPEVVDPQFAYNKELFFTTRYENGEKYYLLRNGQRLEQVNFRTLFQAEPYKDKMIYTIVYNDDPENVVLMDADMREIIPKGYFIPKKMIDARFLRHGLMPVYDELNSGVIDLDGNWVIPPGYNSYHVFFAYIDREVQRKAGNV